MDKDLQKLIDEVLTEFPLDRGEKCIEESSFRVYNATLCPDLWDKYQHLDGRVRVGLLKLAYDFYEKTEFVAPIMDVFLMGSIANYNWTPESDADVHIIIDFSKLQMPLDTAKEVVKTASSKWNDEHDIKVKTHKVELNIQSHTEKKPYVLGMYSLVRDQWIRHPMRYNVTINKSAIQEKYSAMKKYLEAVIRSGNRDTMKNAKKYLDSFRQQGLDNQGELSTENIVYKILRSKGIIKMLKDSIVSMYDKEMTVPEAVSENVSSDVKSKYFNIKFGESDVGKGTGKIYLGDEWFANTYMVPEGYGINDIREGEWIINAHKGAFRLKFISPKISFKTLENLLKYLDEWHDTLPVKEAFLDQIPDVPYLIVGVTDGRNKSFAGITGGHEGHANLLSPGQWDSMDNPPYLKWRYKKNDDTLYIDPDRDTTGKIPVITQYLKSKFGIVPKNIKQDEDYYNVAHRVNEVTQKDIKSRHPQSIDQWQIDPISKNWSPKMTMMTLDNLKALREKSYRLWKAARESGNEEIAKYEMEQFGLYNDELKKRLRDINAPVVEGDSESFYFPDNEVFHWTSDSCRGPFIIFFVDGKEHFVAGISPGKVNLDGKEMSHDEGNAIHRDLSTFIQGIFPNSGYKHNALKYHIEGRTWSKDGNVYMSFWNKDITKVGFHNLSDILQKIAYIQTGIKNPSSIFLQLDDLEMEYITISLTDFRRDTKNPEEPDQDIDQGSDDPKRLLHLMSPEEKKKALAAMGAKPKVGDIPDFQKKMLAGVDEGYGAGKPEEDRLHISGERWRIRSKDAPKTPKMVDEELEKIINETLEEFLLCESPKMETLKKNKKPLTDEERQLVMSKDATWHHGPNGEKTPAVWKAEVNGKTWYVTNTHRAMQCKPTLKGAISIFHSFIKSTA